MSDWLKLNWFSLFQTLAVLCGGAFALFQWSKSNQLKRTEFINQIIEKMRFDNEITTGKYLVDYNSDWYNKSFHCEATEYLIDKYFAYLSYICYLIKMRHLKEEDLSLFRYDLSRACGNESSQNYLYNIYHFAKKKGTDCSFEHLIKYGRNMGIIPAYFDDPTSSHYPHILNF